MNGVFTTGMSKGWPATAVVSLAGGRVVATREPLRSTSDELLLVSVSHPPRIGETRSIAALMPQVLARYGLAEWTVELPDASACDKIGVS